MDPYPWHVLGADPVQHAPTHSFVFGIEPNCMHQNPDLRGKPARRGCMTPPPTALKQCRMPILKALLNDRHVHLLAHFREKKPGASSMAHLLAL